MGERVLRAAKKGTEWGLMWVKGHSGVAGNELAGRMSKEKVMEVKWVLLPSTATQAGIRQAYSLFSNPTHEIGQGRAQRPKVPPPGQRTNDGMAASDRKVGGSLLWLREDTEHLLESGCIGGRRRSCEDIWTDWEF